MDRAEDLFQRLVQNGEAEIHAWLLERLGTPFIVKGLFEEAHPDWPQVDFDHERMMTESVRYLVECGHRRIAYLGFDTDRVYATHLRAGFERAMRDCVEVPQEDRGLIFNRHEETSQAQTERWLSRPAKERPTALVVGASSEGTWQGIALALARHGRRIGPGQDDLAVTGLHYEGRPLLFGQAQVFSDIDSLHLTDVMCRQLLAPLLEERPPAQSVVRICPKWHLLSSLRLLD